MGIVYSCDHYVQPDYNLGNILKTPMVDLVDSEFQKKFGTNKYSTLPVKSRSCGFHNLCYGACPKDRILETKSGKLNWLCPGYLDFYRETKYDTPEKIISSPGRIPGRIPGHGTDFLNL